MKVVIIEYSDLPMQAKFMEDERGGRLIFDSHNEADMWLCDNAEPGVVYTQYDGTD